MISYQDWEGYKSKKFPDKGRKRFQNLAPEIITPKGSCTSKSIYTDPSNIQLPLIKKPVSIYKSNMESNNLQHFYEEPRQKKQFQPQTIDFKDERLHLRQEKNNHIEDLQLGIKTFDYANQSSEARFVLEDAMQRKIRVENKRNQIGIHYLGDKSYHIPDYAHNFFKDPSGIIPGSNIQNRHFYLKL